MPLSSMERRPVPAPAGRRRRAAASSGYRRIVVYVAPPASDRAMDVACGLASERHAVVSAVAVIEVPPLLPLEAHMLEEEEDARRLLRRTEAKGDLYGVSVTPTILRARDAAASLVEHAQAFGAEIIVLGVTPRRRRGPRSRVFDRVTQDVLRKAGCRVVLVSLPDSGPAGAQA